MLVSISHLDSTGYAALFHDLHCRIFDSKKKQLAKIPANRGLYALKAPHRLYAGVAQANDPLTMEEIHSRLGHITPEAICQMLTDGVVTGLTLDPVHTTISRCESCEYTKATHKPIGKIRDPPRKDNFGDEVHSDLWGPLPVQMNAHREYFVSFTDYHTRYTTLRPLKSKDETFGAYKDFEAWANTQFNAKIKHLWSDCGCEFLGEQFSRHLCANGMERKLTVHDTPEHNSIAERLNRMLIEQVRAVLHASGLPKSLWGEAIIHMVWLKNRTSTQSLVNKTPYIRKSPTS